MISRREFLPLLAAPALAQNSDSLIEKWGTFELTLRGPDSGNPFVDVSLAARFTLGARNLEVEGFYDGNGVYRVRFMPDAAGEWKFVTKSNRRELDAQEGSFTCEAASTGNRGPVTIRNTHHFAYADGTPYLPFGTTCYAWTHQGEDLERQTLATLRTAPFNKMRMCVFPKHYAHNSNEPPLYPFERDASGKNGFTRFNPLFFRHLERRVSDLRGLGIEADLILLHPYDRWGYADMGAEADDRYLRYIVARMAAHRNVWWSMANEYNFMKKKSLEDWERVSRLVREKDPYGHLMSIHNGGELDAMYDHAKPYITHVSLQSSEMTQGAKLRERFRKPVIYDECKYEGNIAKRWGDISARELVHRFWVGTVEGCYVGHGETYAHPEEILWWSKGGVLHGESPKRIAFLREILERGPKQGLAKINAYYPCAGVEGEYYLYYFDVHQPVEFEFELPKGARFAADLIDPWEMKIVPAEGALEGRVKLKLPGRPYQAVRVRKL